MATGTSVSTRGDATAAVPTGGGDAIPAVPSGGDATPAVPSGGDAIPAVPSGGDATPAVPSGGDATAAVPSGGDATAAVPSGGDATPAGAWLAGEPVVERFALDAHSWVDIVRGFVPRADEVHRELESAVRWEQGKVFRYERWIDEPRLGAWQKGAGRHPALAEAEAWISERYRVRFDGVALALYRHERDSVAFHRDRELKWLDDTVIGVLTLGAHRPWLMKPITGQRYEEDAAAGAFDLSPAAGDLFVMGGRCQADWLHAVPKVQGRVRSRISAQWRWTSRRGRPDTAPSYYAPRHFTSGTLGG